MAAGEAVTRAWDSIEGLPDPQENLHLVGHEATLDILARHYASGRMHHAWLLGGPGGIGKATLVCRFAGHVFRNPDPNIAPDQYVRPPASDAVEGRVAAGGHTNLLHLRRPWDHKEKRWRKFLTVDEVRQTVPFFGNSSGEPGWRVCIVDTADDLNPSAANALLKVLEEPPPRTLFFVLAQTPRGTLATIRSRCQKLAIAPLVPNQVVEALNLLGVGRDEDQADIELAARLSGGSVRRAVLLLGGDGIALYRRFVTLAAGAARPDWTAIHAMAGEIAPAAQEGRYRLLLDLAHDYVARRVRNEAEPAGEAASAQGTSVLARWVEVWEKTRRSAELADAYNLDRKQVILNLFEAMREAA